MKTKSLIVFATIIILLSVFLAPLAYKEYFENEKAKSSNGKIILYVIGGVVGGIAVIVFLYLAFKGLFGK